MHSISPRVWGGAAAAGVDGDDGDFSESIAALAWREPAGGRGIKSELLILSHRCVLHRLSVPSAAYATVHGHAPSRAAPPLLLGAHHGLVASMSYDGTSGVVAVGGGGGLPSAAALLLAAKAPPDAPPLVLPSLSLWRLSDGAPHATLLFATTAASGFLRAAEPAAVAAAGGAVMARPKLLWRRLRAAALGDGVAHSVALADGGGRLAVLTLHGDLYVWDTRSLVAAAAAGDAPAAAAAAAAPPRVPPLPMVVASGTGGAQWLSAYWWDGRPDALVLACRSGAVSVSALPGGQQLPPRRVATDELRNLLGAQPEVFASRALLSAASAGRFFVLEREATIVRAAAGAAAAPAAAPPRVGAPATSPAAGGAREAEAWRLVSLSKTSPQQLFERKIAVKEYGDAPRKRHTASGAHGPHASSSPRASFATGTATRCSGRRTMGSRPTPCASRSGATPTSRATRSATSSTKSRRCNGCSASAAAACPTTTRRWRSYLSTR